MDQLCTSNKSAEEQSFCVVLAQKSVAQDVANAEKRVRVAKTLQY